MIEPITSSINNKWNLSKTKVTAIVCLLGFFASLLFATGSGIYWLELLDHFIANFGLVLIGLVECIIIGWFYRASKIRQHANKTSEIMIGRWWDFLIKYVIPSVLIILLIISVFDNIINPYGNFDTWVIILGGVLPCIIIFLAAFVLTKYKNQKKVE